MRATMLSDDGDAIVILSCHEDVLSIFVGEATELDNGEFAWRPDAPGNAAGRFQGGGQNSATSVRWQPLVTAAGDPTILGVFLPKSYRRSFIDALRSDNSLVIDWFYGTDTFEWPKVAVEQEMPLSHCGW